MAYLLDADILIQVWRSFCDESRQPLECGGFDAAFPVFQFDFLAMKRWESGVEPAALQKKIKIPDACIGLGIKCMTPFEMLRLEQARFVLGAKK